MKRWLYALLGLIVLLVAIVCLLPWWITPKQVEHLANRFLAPDYELQLPERWHLQTTGLQLPELEVRTSQCAIATFGNVHINWWEPRRLEVAHASLDYKCLNSLPSSNDNTKTPLNLTALFSAIPSAEVSIQHLQLVNSKELNVPPIVRQLLDANVAATAH